MTRQIYPTFSKLVRFSNKFYSKIGFKAALDKLNSRISDIRRLDVKISFTTISEIHGPENLNEVFHA